MPVDSSRNGHRLNTINPSIAEGAFEGGYRGVVIQKSGNLPNGWTDWPNIWYTSADSSGNGHSDDRLKKLAPRYLISHFGGF